MTRATTTVLAMTTRAPRLVHDAHRHLGVLPAFPFYGGPPVNPDTTARATIDELVADLDAEGTERALVIPNYGVPDPTASFALNELVVEAAQRDDRIVAGLWTSPRPQDAVATEKALALAGEDGVAALKLSFLLGGGVDDPACLPQLDAVFGAAREHGLVVHVHTSPGAASDLDQVGKLVAELCIKVLTGQRHRAPVVPEEKLVAEAVSDVHDQVGKYEGRTGELDRTDPDAKVVDRSSELAEAGPSRRGGQEG